MRIHPGLLVAGILALPSIAVGQTDLSPNDIVRHFEAQIIPPPPPPPPAAGDPQGAGTGKTRAVHFGASGFGEGDDGAAAPAAAKPTVNEAAAAAADAAYNLLVSFDVNSDRLTPRAQRNLAAFAEALKHPALAAMNFAVEGHTDSSGTETYNLTLSERRANAVVLYLTGLGIEQERLQARGFGETRPANTGGNRGQNRRVETRLVP